MKELRDDDCYLLFNDVSDDPSTEVSLHELCRRRETKLEKWMLGTRKVLLRDLGAADPSCAVTMRSCLHEKVNQNSAPRSLKNGIRKELKSCGHRRFNFEPEFFVLNPELFTRVFVLFYIYERLCLKFKLRPPMTAGLVLRNVRIGRW